MARVVRSAIHTYEDDLCASVLDRLQRLTPATLGAIDALLAGEDDDDPDFTANSSSNIHANANANADVEPFWDRRKVGRGAQAQITQVRFLDLKADPGRIGLDSMLREIAKLQRLRQVTSTLPPDLFAGVSPRLLQRYRDRIASEPVRE